MVRGIAEGGLHWKLKRNVTEQDEVLLSYERSSGGPTPEGARGLRA